MTSALTINPQNWSTNTTDKCVCDVWKCSVRKGISVPTVWSAAPSRMKRKNASRICVRRSGERRQFKLSRWIVWFRCVIVRRSSGVGGRGNSEEGSCGNGLSRRAMKEGAFALGVDDVGEGSSCSWTSKSCSSKSSTFDIFVLGSMSGQCKCF